METRLQCQEGCGPPIPHGNVVWLFAFRLEIRDQEPRHPCWGWQATCSGYSHKGQNGSFPLSLLPGNPTARAYSGLLKKWGLPLCRVGLRSPQKPGTLTTARNLTRITAHLSNLVRGGSDGIIAIGGVPQTETLLRGLSGDPFMLVPALFSIQHGPPVCSHDAQEHTTFGL